MGKVFKKPSYKIIPTPTPGAAPAPAEENTQKPAEDSLRKKKKGKASLMVDSTNNATGSGGTGINL